MNKPNFQKRMANAGFSSKNISAGSKGEVQVFNELLPNQRDGWAVLREVVFTYTDTQGRSKEADIDIVVICGNKIWMIDAKQWANGLLRRRFRFFGPILMYPDKGRPRKYPDPEKGFPEVSSLAPQKRNLARLLHGLNVEFQPSFSVIANPKTRLGFGVRKATRGTSYMTWGEFQKWAKKPPRPGDKQLTQKIVRRIDPSGVTE